MDHNATKLLGSIVAFEGRSDTISTQLRLLPASAQVLILPGVHCYMPTADDSEDQEFDVRLYVRQVHDALLARCDAARAFLRGSTLTTKRLVFMNGGTPSAMTLCIKAIMEHQACGSEAQARAILDDLLKDGLAGLNTYVAVHRNRDTFGYTATDEGRFDDPITRAMRAADALDRQTADLQPSSDLDLTTTHQRSCSLPLYGYSDEFGDAAPFFVFGAAPADDGDISIEETASSLVAPMTPTLAIMHFDQRSQRPAHLSSLNIAPSSRSPSCIGESYEPTLSKTSAEAETAPSISDAISIRTLENNVVYGEASLLDMTRSGGKGSPVRVKSLDRIYPASPKVHRDLCIPSNSWFAEPETPRMSRPLSMMTLMGTKDSTLISSNSGERPRTAVVRPRLPIIKVAPVPQGKKNKNKHLKAGTTYVDRGTDANTNTHNEIAFQPVFPCTEDLLVYLKEKTIDAVLDSAVDTFKDGRYPLLSHSPTASEPENAQSSLPETPKFRACEARGSFATQSEEELPGIPVSVNMDDYDPFTYMQPTLRPPKSLQLPVKVTIVRPPTPASTPPPPSVAMSEHEHKFHEFAVAPKQTAVAVQNSLRSILKDYFPPDGHGYHQFRSALLPEWDGSYKPIIRTMTPGSPQSCDGRVTQILAIGSQKDVKKEYSLAITDCLEKLGSGSSGLRRADRLDFRYLLANAMQAFTAQPLADQTSDNPFANPYLLATLIVPHLETYLALHSSVRYILLQYPPEHLATILALQKLLGVDLMKVAQIVDSNSSQPMPFTHLRGISIGSKSEESSAKWPSPSPFPSTHVPASKANYLLTSTASDKNISDFVSTVWNIPAEVSSPESPGRESKRKARPLPLRSKGDSLSPFPKIGSPSPPFLKAKAPLPPSPNFSATKTQPHSTAETLGTLKSAKSRRSPGKSQGYAQTTSDAAPKMIFDINDDSDYDMEERRLMPLFMNKAGTRKHSSRKALKLLGLA